jgi:hypothetical protein
MVGTGAVERAASGWRSPDMRPCSLSGTTAAQRRRTPRRPQPTWRDTRTSNQDNQEVCRVRL